MRLRALGCGLGLGVIAVLAGCEENPVIGERERVVTRFVDIRRENVNGQARLEFTVNVPGDAIHPHIEGQWTVANVERPVDTYVFPAGEYDPNQLPAAQSYFWTSTRGDGSDVNTSRTQELHIHPTPGDWVIVFYNPGINPQAQRTELSAEIEINFFR